MGKEGGKTGTTMLRKLGTGKRVYLLFSIQLPPCTKVGILSQEDDKVSLEKNTPRMRALPFFLACPSKHTGNPFTPPTELTRLQLISNISPSPVEQTALPARRRGPGPDLRDQAHHRHVLPQLRSHGLVPELHPRRLALPGPAPRGAVLQVGR